MPGTLGRSRYTYPNLFCNPTGRIRLQYLHLPPPDAVYNQARLIYSQSEQLSMNTRRSFHMVCLTMMLASIIVPRAASQSSSAPGSLSVEDVLALSKAGVAEDVIITKIRMNGKAFDLNAAEIREIHKAGISDLIINVLLNPAYKPEPPAPAPTPSHTETETTPKAPPPPAPPAKHYPADDHASKVPPEPGVYHFPANLPVRIAVKVLLGMQEGAGLGKVVLKKPKTIAYLVGTTAETRIADPAPVFYLRLPEGKAIEDYVLVALDHKGDRRGLEMGPAGPKQADVRRQFDNLEVGANLFKLTVAKLAKGEYLFFQLGSAEPPKGIYGRGFDFGIDGSSK
jgi:hypothetical protein